MTELYLVKIETTQPMIWKGVFYEKNQEVELIVTQSEAKVLKQIAKVLSASHCESNKSAVKKVKSNVNNGNSK